MILYNNRGGQAASYAQMVPGAGSGPKVPEEKVEARRSPSPSLSFPLSLPFSLSLSAPLSLSRSPIIYISYIYIYIWMMTTQKCDPNPY